MRPIDIDLGICRVRPFRPDDAPSLARHADDREVWAQLRDGFPHPYTLADAQGWLAQVAMMESPTDFAIEVGGEAAGSIGLAPDPTSRSAELGYWLGRRSWGRGIATAAVRAVADHAFAGPDLGLDRLHACIFEGNPASARVLEKTGFRLQGRDGCGSVKAGKVIATTRYILTRADHRPGPSPSESRPNRGRSGGTGR